MDLKNLFKNNHIFNFWKLCLIIVGNFLDLKKNNKILNKKQDKDVFLFLKYYLLRRKNFMKKQRKWLINIAGLYSTSDQLVKKIINVIALCSLDQKF
jgi:predicted metal-dependent hydrolase